MPALPNVANVIRVALGFDLENVPVALTRFYIAFTGTAPTVANLASFNSAINSAMTADLASLLNSSSIITSIESIDLTSSTGAVDTSVTAVDGTRTGTVLPADTSLVASYTIARRYRGGHPRGYWPLGTATDLASNRSWSSSFVTAGNTGLTNFFAAVLAGGWTGSGTLTHVNVSYFHGFTVVTNPLTGRARNVPTVRVTPLQDVVTGIACKPSVGTQRRRLQFQD